MARLQRQGDLTPWSVDQSDRWPAGKVIEASPPLEKLPKKPGVPVSSFRLPEVVLNSARGDPLSQRDDGQGSAFTDEDDSGLSNKCRDLEHLVSQLKIVVRKQHAKIEELRSGSEEKVDVKALIDKADETDDSKTEYPIPKVQALMIAELKRTAVKDREERAKMKSQIRRLQNLVEDLRATGQTHKLANKRAQSILTDLGTPSFITAAALSASPSTATLPSSVAATPSSLMELSSVVGNDSTLETQSSIGASPSPQLLQTLAGPGAAANAALRLASPYPSEGLSHTGAEAGAVTARAAQPSATTRLQQCQQGILTLWRMDTPRDIMVSLISSAWNLLRGGAPAILTLYIIDPALQSAMQGNVEDDSEEAKMQRWQPTKFYLQGKTTVHAYQKQSGRRVEPPRFADLDVLPLRGVSQLALPLQTNNQPVSAVLQVVIPQQRDGSPGQGRVGRPRVRDELEGVVDPGRHSEPVVTLTDAQVSGLNLLCGTAASINEMRVRSAKEQEIRKRSEEVLVVCAEVSSVPRLTDFEQAVKIVLMKFFNVACVRLCFFDNESRVLLAAPTQPHRAGAAPVTIDPTLKKAMVGRRQLVRISLQEGIVGKCARKVQNTHVERLIGSADISERADGVDMSGRSTDLNLMCGPMVAHLSDKMILIGTLQVIEKKLPAGVVRSANSSACAPFSEEDERFFASILKILGLAAYRTMQLQARSDRADVDIHVEKLLE